VIAICGCGTAGRVAHIIIPQYWNFEEGPGSRTAEDVTGNGHDATWRGGRSGADKWPDSALAGGDHAQDFRGTGDDTLRINNKQNFPTGSDDRTFMVWFKKSSRGDMAFFQHGCWRGCQGTKSSFHRPNLWQHTSASPRAPVLTRPAAREQPVESWWYPGPAREARSRSAASCKIAGSCSTSLSSSLRAPTATGVGVSPRRVREPRVLFVSGAPRRFANHQWASGKPTQPLVGAARPSGPPRPGQSTPIIAIGRGAVVIVVGD